MNGTGDRREIEALIQGYLDGSLTENDSQQLLAVLRHDPSYVDMILEGLRTDCLIRAVVAEAAAAGEMIQERTSEIPSRLVPQNRAPKVGRVTPCEPRPDSELLSFDAAAHGVTRPAFTARRWPQALALAASVVVLLGLSLWLFGPTVGEPALAEVRGDGASIQRGTEFIPASEGFHLQPTDVLLTGPNGAATVSFGPEKTKIEVGADAQLKLISLTKGKRFEMRTGKLEAAVARQRPFHRMRISTPQAEARVLGTRFMLNVTTNITRLDVALGEVRLTRTSDGKWVDVPKEYYAIAAANVHLAALPKTSGILREYWTNILGDHPSQLAREPAFPDRPSGSEMLTNFVVRSDWGDNFGDRIRGFIHPPLTGPYVFWISADENSTLTLSRGEKPEERTQIAAAADGGPPQDWDRHIVQRSNPLTLVAGRRYYIEVIRKADTGLDHLAVAWQPPGGQREIIPGEFLSPVETKKGRR